MACGGCGGGGKLFTGPTRPGPVIRQRMVPNPIAVRQQVQINATQQNMSMARRNIEQKRRIAVLRALGK